MLKFLRIERPTSATRRSSLSAASITCWTRWMLEAKEVTMIRPLQSEKVFSSAGPTLDSDGAIPGGRRWSSRRRAKAALRGPSSASRDMSAGLAVDRGLVELVVAGQQHRAQLGGEDDAAHVGDRVREVDQLEPEGAGLDLLARRQLLQRRVGEFVLVELGADHADGQLAAVDHRRRADLPHHVGQRADVVLVAVGEDDRLDVVGAVAQVGEVGQDEIDAEHLGGREHQAGVDDDDPAVLFDDGHVLADLPQPAEGRTRNFLTPGLVRRRGQADVPRAPA